MALVSEVRRRARRHAVPTLGAVLVAYFLVNLLQGDRGFLAWVQLQGEIEAAKAKLAETSARREALEARTARLRGPDIDADLLDERARIMSGLANPDDLVILDLPPTERGAAPAEPD
jgi:cell division protein FtsB